MYQYEVRPSRTAPDWPFRYSYQTLIFIHFHGDVCLEFVQTASLLAAKSSCKLIVPMFTENEPAKVEESNIHRFHFTVFYLTENWEAHKSPSVK
ncbi:hypothetical protein AVEN_129564-1 [Araneus ventricosus]|uniref:Uncharacterized protein n=1 Tax=Araneus ventricosus TaxID=182803 RepID=A0A4Y2MT92_ARAVE|nr:hypothetical protein AVEN_129564-1 [Araneus ventricosus]